MGAADFLFAFDEKGHVRRHRRARLHVGLDGVHVGEELSLVVGGAASEQLTVAHDRFERRRVPRLERLGRLHVVVAVDQDPGSAGPVPPGAGDDDRVAVRRVQFDIQTQRAKEPGEPVGARQHVAAMFGLGRDAREPHERFELVEGSLAILCEVLLDHDRVGRTLADLALQVTA